MSSRNLGNVLLALAPLAFVPSDTTSVLLLDSAALDGSIQVSSFGIAEIAADRNGVLRTLHVRASYTNRDDLRPWTIDASALRVQFGDVLAAPVFANSDVSTLPLLRVSAREHRVLDVYFEVPVGVTNDELDELTVLHRVSTPDQRYQGRTQLRRVEPAAAAEPTPQVGWGSRWWATPNHAWSTFYHRDGRLVPRPPTMIGIAKAPRWSYDFVPAIESTPRS